MKVCPKCGLPFPTVTLYGPVSCSYCGWSGDSTDLPTVGDDNKFQNDDLQKLREMFIFLAKEVSPMILRKLIKLGIFKAETSELKNMVPLISNVTRAMFLALVESLCVPEEGDGEIGRTIHP